MNKLDYYTDKFQFVGKIEVSIPVITSTKKFLNKFFDGTENVEQVTGITRGKNYTIIEVEGFGDVFDVTFVNDNGTLQTLGSFFFEDIHRQYFFEHPVISGVVPVDNQEFIDKLNKIDLKEGLKVNKNPYVYIKSIQEDGTIILSGY